jgi:septal ring factor EnvC (AmiA/AmiB activator)
VRAFVLPSVALSIAAASSAPAQQPNPFDAQLRQARAEQAAAEAQAAKLERAAAQARSEADRIRAQQAAAAQAIEASEARITAADMQLRLVSAALATRRQQLVEEQRPIASLLAALAVMGQRPPLVAIADRGSVDDLVKVRLLLDSTMPVIRARTAALSAQLSEGKRLQQAASVAKDELLASRQDMVAKRDRFAALERKAVAEANASGAQALSVGDVALAAGEYVEKLRGTEAGSRAAAALAADLARDEAAPARPVPPESGGVAARITYRLPAAAEVIDGLGSVNSSGVRSRGLTLATGRGMSVAAPAAGVVRFSGPFRDYDGILIIDHGHGWMTLLLNVASPLKPGDKVRLGDAVGRTLGALGVELSQNGRRFSPALIAGSSQNLSKGRKGG